tara:strand:- start:262 stop:753 length:492 start_codon:yes stop_codon:yes gene_type:complete
MESAYKTLEASPSESFEEIREKFIRKIIKIHPDKDELKSEEAKTLTEAWAYIKENHNNNNKATEPIASVVSQANQDSEMKQFLKKIYNEGKVEKLEDKEDDKSWLTSLYDYLWGDDSDEEDEVTEDLQEETVTEDLQEETVDESKLYNEVDDTNKKIEKTLRE